MLLRDVEDKQGRPIDQPPGTVTVLALDSTTGAPTGEHRYPVRDPLGRRCGTEDAVTQRGRCLGRQLSRLLVGTGRAVLVEAEPELRRFEEPGTPVPTRVRVIASG